MSAYLVAIDGLRGTEVQVWYQDGGEFVGAQIPSGTKMRLPDRDEPWSIAEALEWGQRHPDAIKSVS